MRFFVDNALPPRLAELLTEAGCEASHVRDQNLQAASDSRILEYAADDNRIIVSADIDFGVLLALSKCSRPSFILFRDSGLTCASDYLRRILESQTAIELVLKMAVWACLRATVSE